MGDNGDQDVRAQAAEWFARLKTVPVSRGTLEEFFAWKRIDRHSAAFDEVQRFWSDAGEIADQPSVIEATHAAFARGNQRNRQRFGLVWKLVPALAVAVLLVGTLLSLTLRTSGEHYTTRIGEQRAITLEDGSKLTLDTDTRLVVQFQKDRRRVLLDHGRAYFAVAHQAGRPFIVDADGTEVLATGTQFEVRKIAGATDVTLVEGSVQVRSRGAMKATRLKSGQKLSLRIDQPPSVRMVDTGVETSWKRGRIVFDGTTLADAIAEVNRYTNRPVRLDADRFANHRLSGSFDTGDTGSFVDAATALIPVKAVPQPDGSIRLTDASDGTAN